MTYEEIELLLLRGKVAMLPRYKGYFKWDYGKKVPYFVNGDFRKYNIEEEKKRTDWFYII